MKGLYSRILLAIGVSGVVYGIVAFVDYRELLSHQPSGPPPFPADTTSFPPSYAFFAAAPYGILALVLTFAVIFIARLARNNLRNRFCAPHRLK